MRLRRPLPAVQGDTLHIVGVGDNRIGKVPSSGTKCLWTTIGTARTERPCSRCCGRSATLQRGRSRWRPPRTSGLISRGWISPASSGPNWISPMIGSTSPACCSLAQSSPRPNCPARTCSRHGSVTRTLRGLTSLEPCWTRAVHAERCFGTPASAAPTSTTRGFLART